MRVLGFGLLTLTFVACGGSEFAGQKGSGQNNTGSASNGGSDSTGGAGGAQSTGSISGTGDTSSTGGNGGGGDGSGGDGSGGVRPTGGMMNSGGVVSNGGSGNGGVIGLGGSGNGGVVGLGGYANTGGVVANGGAQNTGGAVSSSCDPSCDQSKCYACAVDGFSCCNNACVNLDNDRLNCGKCAMACEPSAPFCGGGSCHGLDCSGATLPLLCVLGQECCGTVCCSNGQICCELQNGGPIGMGCATPQNGTCPPGNPGAVCASPDTPIATPTGPRAIASLRVGDHVLSVDDGRVVDVPLVDVGKRKAHHHRVVRVELSSGAVLEISAPHPTADGRTFGALRSGDTLSGDRVVSVATVPYTAEYTYDVLPASDSGTYFAAGALIGSTLGGSAAIGVAVPAPPLTISR